jgi:multiple antibiotic resistance protein
MHAPRMTLSEYSLLALSSMFVIVDPIAAVPTFLAITPGDSATSRVRTAAMACITAAIVLTVFGLTGHHLFRLLGITMPAFQIAGGIILLMVAMDMLRARRTETRETPAETAEGAAKDDVAITPLAIPMLAGPGACSTVLLLHSKAQGAEQTISLYAAVLIVCMACFIIFWLAATHATKLSPIAIRITTRLMGLLLAAIAMQFILSGLTGHFGIPIQTTG